MWRTRLTGPAKPLIVILGPTAVGKTGLSLELAEAVHGEIIGADSRQVYRYMDIGTAKPTIDERARVPHHLIDVVDPDENLSLAQYQRMTYAAIDTIHIRGNVPLLVGGTGQYISAVVEGWSIPEVPPNPVLRAELEAYAADHGSEKLHQRLAALDPVAAARIDHQNIRRVVRALEVCIESGQPISELQRKQPPPYRVLEIGLTMDRDRLYERADTRVDQMMAHGFLDEVRGLLGMGYDRRLPSMSGLGYAQLAAHLLDGLPLSQAAESTKTATHDFIRRQFTWFRKYNHAVLWHNVEQTPARMILDLSLSWLAENA
jgi:tRNA dimethylallyltransferase